MKTITQKFDYRIKTVDPHIVALLAAIDEVKGQFKAGLRMTPQAITSLKNRYSLRQQEHPRVLKVQSLVTSKSKE